MSKEKEAVELADDVVAAGGFKAEFVDAGAAKNSPIKVELRQLVGKCTYQGREARVAHDVDQIILNGKEVGQVGHAPGAGVVLLHRVLLTDKERKAISDSIEQKRGKSPAQFTSPKVVDLKVLDADDDGESDEYEYE